MPEAKLREKYKGLSRQELLDKAYEIGRGFEMNSQCCSQSTVATIHELLEMDDCMVRAANSLTAGTALQVLGTCGALAGGIMSLDYFHGRPVEKMSYTERIESNVAAAVPAFEAPKMLANKYWKEYGTIICAEIWRQLFGRFFFPIDPEDYNRMQNAGAHSDPTKCGHIVGNATRWVIEILLDKGTLKL